jgi:arylsulfatase A-like enzyme
MRTGNRDARSADLVDILPTVLSVADIAPATSLPGKNLLEAPARTGSFSALHEREGEAAFMWRTKKNKLILVFKRQAQATNYTVDDIIVGEFYDLEADPREWDDLYGKAEVAALQAEYRGEILARLGEM